MKKYNYCGSQYQGSYFAYIHGLDVQQYVFFKMLNRANSLQNYMNKPIKMIKCWS